MDRQELEIAQAAISAPHSITYEEIYSLISETTGVSADDVKAIVQRLVTDGFLRIHAGPPHNLVAGEVVGELARGWYEKGRTWK